MFQIKQVDHLVLRVRDIERMIAFYRDVLGCPVEKVQAELGLYQLRAGSSPARAQPVDGPIGQRGGAAPGHEGRNLEHFCLQVEPWDAAGILAHLRRHGCAPGDEVSRYGADGQGPSIYVDDPEGNVVELKGPPYPG